MKLGNRIKRIIRIEPSEYCLEIEYEDGFRAVVELNFLFGSPKGKPMVLEIVRGNLFRKCFVESGALAWPNGYELCPDAIRQWIYRSTKKKAA